MREGERQDEFYTSNEVLDEDHEVDSDCDDQEYYRRVAEEVSRRKNTISGTNPVAKNSPIPPGSSHGSSHGRPMSTSNHGGRSSPTTSTPKLSLSQPGSTKDIPATTTPKTPASHPSPQTVTPITPTPPQPPVSTPASRAAAARPNAATAGPASVSSSFVVSADRPFSATSVPGAVLPAGYLPVATPTSNYNRPNPSLVPDEKALKTLVLMGFSRPTATLALQRTNNNSELAAEFLLEHTAAELNTMLGGIH